MVFCVFIFIFMFRNNVIREQLGQNNFRCCCFFFSRKYHSESTWSQRCSKFSINNYEAPWQRHLKDTLQLKILWTSVSSLHQDIELIIVCFSFSQTSLVFKFNLMLIEQFFATIYLPFNLLIWYLEVHPVPLRFFHKSQEIFMSLNVVFLCESLQLQNVIIFLFSMKH